MSTEWLIAGGVLLVVGTVVGRWAARRGAEPDLGAVSEQWLSEHRLSQSAADHS